jgi:hypothetical protein
MLETSACVLCESEVIEKKRERVSGRDVTGREGEGKLSKQVWKDERDKRSKAERDTESVEEGRNGRRAREREKQDHGGNVARQKYGASRNHKSSTWRRRKTAISID